MKPILTAFAAALVLTLPASAGARSTSLPTPVCSPSWGTITIPVCI